MVRKLVSQIAMENKPEMDEETTNNSKKNMKEKSFVKFVTESALALNKEVGDFLKELPTLVDVVQFSLKEESDESLQTDRDIIKHDEVINNAMIAKTVLDLQKDLLIVKNEDDLEQSVLEATFIIPGTTTPVVWADPETLVVEMSKPNRKQMLESDSEEETGAEVGTTVSSNSDMVESTEEATANEIWANHVNLARSAFWTWFFHGAAAKHVMRLW